MYTVTVESTFVASHQLTMPDGEKEELHTHDWIVRVAVGAEEVDQWDLAIDFVELKAIIEQITDPFANRNLEELPCFEGINASTEKVTKYIYDKIEPLLATRLNLQYVEVMESPGCWTKYTK